MMMNRRQALMSTLFGAGLVGLRSLATGLPAALLLNPRKALAATPPSSCGAPSAQFVIFTTCGSGDPLNANVPGTYIDPKITHSKDPTMAATPLTLSGQQWVAAKPWASLPQNVLDRTTFWHVMTSTPVHPKEPDVLKLMGITREGEMLPSIIARYAAPCLGTIQQQPLSIGAANPSEGLTFGGQAQPIIPPLALKATLTSPAGPLTNLQPLRDKALSQLYDVYKNGATAAQRAYIDSLVTSQSQVRNLEQDLVSQLASITDNSADAQVKAAVALIRMKASPVIAIRLPWGGDNHHDPDLAAETSQTASSVASIASLMSLLQSNGLADKVTLTSLHVFGRTLGPANTDGRSHNPNHQVSFAIGSAFRGGVIGAVGQVGNDYGATAIDSKTGKGGAAGDIEPASTLGSFGQTLLTGLGVPPASVAQEITAGRIVPAALAAGPV
jgi:hypothetical protein